MSRAYLERLEAKDHGAAADLARHWGYPREFLAIELDEATAWYMQGDRALWWYQPLEVDAPYGVPLELASPLALHACVAPEHRGRMMTPEHLYLLCSLAEVEGGTRLYVVDPDERQRALRRVLRHLGWEADGVGVYTDLGLWMGEGKA